MILEKSEGPACPRCGCRDAAILRPPADADRAEAADWFAGGRARCNHCRTRFSFRAKPAPPP